MSKKGIIQNALVIVLGLAIISMSVGYAAYDTSLKSEESTTFEMGNWDVHLENPVRTINSTIENTQVISTPVVNNVGTEVSFGVSMRPEDIYEFSVDVKNAGTFDAKLANYNLVATQNGVNVPIEKNDNAQGNTLLTYEVDGVSDEETLNKNGISTKTVRIINNATTGDAVNYEFKFNMIYVQNNQK